MRGEQAQEGVRGGDSSRSPQRPSYAEAAFSRLLLSFGRHFGEQKNLKKSGANKKTKKREVKRLPLAPLSLLVATPAPIPRSRSWIRGDTPHFYLSAFPKSFLYIAKVITYLSVFAPMTQRNKKDFSTSESGARVPPLENKKNKLEQTGTLPRCQVIKFINFQIISRERQGRKRTLNSTVCIGWFSSRVFDIRDSG